MAILDTLLPQQGSSYGAKWSLDRDAQFRAVLAEAFRKMLGSGIVAGGVVTATGGFGAQVASGTTFFSEGVAYTISAARALAAPLPSATNYVWWKLTKVAADQTEPTELDTWTLSIDYTAVDVAPSADHYPLAHLVCDDAGITSVVDPPGKYCGVLRQDESILRDGTRDYTGDQNMAGHRLKGLPNPAAGTDATPRDWVLDAIADAIDALDIPSLAGVILASGGVAFTGNQSLGNNRLTDLSDPVNDKDAANKQWVVALLGGGTPLSFLTLDGLSVMGGNLDMGNHQVVNAADPTTAQALVTRAYLETQLGNLVITGFLPLGGGTMGGPIDMGNHPITNLTDPSADQHAATQGWTNTRVGTRLPLSGGTMTGPINMGGKAITELPNPTNPQDPATKGWAEANFAPLAARKTKEFGLYWPEVTEADYLLRYPMTQTTWIGGAASLASQGVLPAGGGSTSNTIQIYHCSPGETPVLIGTATFASGATAAVMDFPEGEVELAAADWIEAKMVGDLSVSGWVALALVGEVAA